MAARVTATEVKLIILDADTEIGSDDITPFIDAANLTINDVIDTSLLSAAQLKEIERWLAAHFTVIKYTRIDSERAGSVSQKVQYRLGLGLDVTLYGQQAKRLDTTGALSSLDKGKKRAATMTTLNPTLG